MPSSEFLKKKNIQKFYFHIWIQKIIKRRKFEIIRLQNMGDDEIFLSQNTH